MFPRLKKLTRGIVVRAQSVFADKAARRHALVGPADLWEMKRSFQIRFLKSMGLKPEHRLMDIGCGTLRGGIPVIDYLDEGRYVGIEARVPVLDEARHELSEAGLTHKNPTLIHSEDFSCDVAGSFDYIWAFSVLIHMDDDTLDRCFAFVGRLLASGGRFYANVNVDAPAGTAWQGFPVVSHPLEFYADSAVRYGLTVNDLGNLSSLGHESGRASQDQQRMLVFARWDQVSG